jgi:GntR family transcriptional regulator
MVKHTKLVISQTDGRPMYLQIIEQVKRRIAAGDWLPGQELPSIRALAADVQVSVITVKRAYMELEREGLIVTRQGKGSLVAETADLGVTLQERQLDEYLAQAAAIADLLGISSRDLQARLSSFRQAARKEKA